MGFKPRVEGFASGLREGSDKGDIKFVMDGVVRYISDIANDYRLEGLNSKRVR